MMRRYAYVLLAAVARAAWHDVAVALDGVTMEFNPANINADVFDAIHFIIPDSTMSIVQSKSLDEPCTPLPGGFRNVVGLGKLDVTINDTKPMYVFAEKHCTEGMVFVVNPAQSGDFDTLVANARALADPGSESSSSSSSSPLSSSSSSVPPATTAPSPSSVASSLPPTSHAFNSTLTSISDTPSSTATDTTRGADASPTETRGSAQSESSGIAENVEGYDGLSPGVLAAAVVCSILGTAVLIFLFFFLRKRRRTARGSSPPRRRPTLVEWPPSRYAPRPFTTVPASSGTSTIIPDATPSPAAVPLTEKARIRAAARTPLLSNFDHASPLPGPSPSLIAPSSAEPSSSGSGSDSTARRRLDMVQEMLQRGVSTEAVLMALQTNTTVPTARTSMMKPPPPTYAP